MKVHLFIEFFQPGSFRFVFLFCLAHFMHGVGATPLFTIGISYIDENVNFNYAKLLIKTYGIIFRQDPHFLLSTLEYSTHLLCLGLLLDFSCLVNSFFGTLILWLLGKDYKNCLFLLWVLNYSYYRIIDLDETDPKWVGAWYIGFLLAVLFGLLAVFPILTFPKLLPESLKWHRFHIPIRLPELISYDFLIYRTRLQEETMGTKKRTPECCGIPPTSNRTAAIFTADGEIRIDGLF